MSKRNACILLAVLMLALSSIACDDGGIVDNDCATCGGPETGGQVMNPDNVVQQGYSALEVVWCNDPGYKDYNSWHCNDVRSGK